MCVESALAVNDFNQAYSYCNPYFINLESTSDISWTTCFQVGKYISPFWDSPSEEILNKQISLLAYVVEKCPQNQIVPVLSCWRRAEAQLVEQQSSAKSPKSSTEEQGISHPQLQAHSNHHPRQPPAYTASRLARAIGSSAAAFTKRNEPDEQGESTLQARKRDQLSNMIVSGLGWAIGANRTE